MSVLCNIETAWNIPRITFLAESELASNKISVWYLNYPPWYPPGTPPRKCWNLLALLTSAVSCENTPYDLCRCRTKRSIVGWGPANPSVGMTQTIEYISCKGSRVRFYSRCHTQRRIGHCRGPAANPSLRMTTTKILRHDFPWHDSSYIMKSVYHVKSGEH